MKKIPEPSRKRLLKIASILSRIEQEKITSPELSALTLWGEATIRRDISLLELHNGASNGWDTKELAEEIEKALKVNGDNRYTFCIVGLEKLGQALLESSVFEDTPFLLAAGFDTNMNRIELLRSKIPLFPTVDLEEKIRTLKIQYAVLAVPDEKAQFMADRLVKYGIKGIVNYTNTALKLPREIHCADANPLSLLRELVF